MIEPDADPGALAAAAGLTESLQAMTRQMSRLSRSDKRLRQIVAGLVASLCLDIAITAGLGIVTVRQNDTQNMSHADLITACRLANVNRSQDIAVWNRLLRLPASASRSQRAEVTDLERLVRVKDSLRDCATLYRK